MNNLHTHYSHYLVIILFSLSAIRLSAQPVSPVDSGNINQFLNEMDDYFGQIMTVSTTDIDLLLQPFVSGTVGSLCTQPAPSVYSQDDQQITFRFGGPNSGTYRTAYLNLRTGDQGTYITNQNNHTFNVEDGLYLFAFQQLCGTEVSRSVIIILDKVVALTENTTLDCNCIQTVTYSGQELDGLSLSDFYQADILVKTTTTQLTVFQMHLQRICPGCTDYYINPYCHSNTPTTYEHDVAYLELEGVEGGVIALLLEDLQITTNLPAGYEAVVALCKGSTPPPINGGFGNRISHEIPGRTYRIQQLTQTKGTYHLTLFNQNGQLIFQQSFNENVSITDSPIDLSPYPSGIYYLRIEEPNSGETYKLIRY